MGHNSVVRSAFNINLFYSFTISIIKSNMFYITLFINCSINPVLGDCFDRCCYRTTAFDTNDFYFAKLCNCFIFCTVLLTFIAYATWRASLKPIKLLSFIFVGSFPYLNFYYRAIFFHTKIKNKWQPSLSPLV